jgi:hypothetical protein
MSSIACLNTQKTYSKLLSLIPKIKIICNNRFEPVKPKSRGGREKIQ